ncbi:MAG: peptidase M50, partial [Methanomicrobiales archaeon]|nr:peptidase M50 [Methanomicrobiales archaeon]
MDGSFKLGRLFGIPVLIHFTFLLIIPLFAWVIGSDIGFTVNMVRNIFHVSIDDQLILSGYVPYILGGTVAIGLFIGVFIHELAHSLVALRSGIEISNITLLFFGGVAAIEEQEPEPGTEFVMALAGPLTSLALGLIS